MHKIHNRNVIDAEQPQLSRTCLDVRVGVNGTLCTSLLCSQAANKSGPPFSSVMSKQHTLFGGFAPPPQEGSFQGSASLKVFLVDGLLMLCQVQQDLKLVACVKMKARSLY